MSIGTPFRWVFCSVLISFGFSLQASNLLIGEPALVATGNCDPFGCPGFFGLGTYQQVYASSAFSGEVNITGLTFYDEQVQNGGVPASGTYTLAFSYSSNSVGDLSTVSPGANIASVSQVFYTGALPSLAQTTLDFAGTPFDYNPAAGDLLLTVTVSSGTNGSPTLYLDEAAALTETSNVYFGTYNGQPISGGNDIGGLVTGFTVAVNTSVPEPGSLLLVLGGVGMFAYGWRRRRRA